MKSSSMVDMGIKNFLIFLFLSIVHARNDCPTSHCNKILIQFPFWLQGTESQFCAPPGFNLSCNAQKHPILHIPGSGSFYVTSIYYFIKRVTLEDVEGCLPERLLSFDLSSTPFMAVQYRKYTFYRCPKGQVTYSAALECASNATSDIFAARNQADSRGLFSRCNKISTVQVPVSPYNDLDFPVGLDLTWNARDCQDCTQETVAVAGETNRGSDSGGIALKSTMTTLSLLVIIVCCVSMIKRGIRNHQNRNLMQISEACDLTGRGLDKSTIETYRKITVGESRAEVHYGVICSICLADYAPEDTIRFIPQCNHCFHIDCIDKWLSISRNCPICRIYLSNTNSVAQ